VQEALELAALVALGGCDGFGQIFSDQVGSEARPSGEMPRFNCLDPDQWDWTAACLMEVSDDVPFVLEFVDIVGSVTELLGSRCSGWLAVEVEIPESAGAVSAF
jgi:hypothetical protein